MRIGIDASSLCIPRTGIGNYLYNILIKLKDIDNKNEYFLYSHIDFDLPFQDHHWHKRVKKGTFKIPETIWFSTIRRKWILKDKIDVFWEAGQILPSHLSSKKVLTIHDLVWYYFPETMQIMNFLISKFLTKRAIAQADHIIAVSRATARSLECLLHIPSDKISVIYEAANERYQFYNKGESAKYIAEKFKTSEKYILTVGTIEPRKNIENLLKAFRNLIDNFKFDYQLLIAGGKGWRNSNIYRTYKRLRFSEKEVKFLGYVPDNDMPRLYSGAKIFVFPSLYEGFGLPPLEAMACGTPVITSNSSSLPEVVGDAGIMFDPYNINEMGQAIYKVLNDNELMSNLRQKGLERVKLFSWEKAASETLRVLQTSGEGLK